MPRRDANTAWYAAADSTAEERRLMCPGAPRPDVVAVLTDTGKLVESVKYGSYGVAFGVPVGDTDSDGDWDATDSAAITGTYEVWKDANLDGVVSAADVTHANSITGSYQSLGRTVLSSTAVNNRKGYAGYELDPALAGNKMHVRNRVLDADLGRWLRRDPVPCNSRPDLYEYSPTSPLTGADPMGLQWANRHFKDHYYHGFGTSIDLAMVGLDDDYRNHEAVVRKSAIIRSEVETQGRELMNYAYSQLDCTCGGRGPTSIEVLPGIPIEDKIGVSRTEFVRNPLTHAEWPEFYADPGGGVQYNPEWERWFWNEDWTYSIGGHWIYYSYRCSARARCAAQVTPTQTIDSKEFGCNITLWIHDMFQDPAGIGYEMPGGTPYLVNTSWNDGVAGSEQVRRPRQRCSVGG